MRQYHLSCLVVLLVSIGQYKSKTIDILNGLARKTTFSVYNDRMKQERFIRAAVAKRTNIKWPDGRIPFVIDSSLESRKALIYRAMNNFHEYTCIRFVSRSTETSYLNLTKLERCWSDSEGYSNKVVVISLGDECYHFGLVVHELCHVVGLIHEHQRPDRDRYVDVLTNNVQANFTNQFETLNETEVELISGYDYHSIMHYDSYAFTKPSMQLQTIIARDENVTLRPLKEKYGLSEKDINSLKQLYNCT